MLLPLHAMLHNAVELQVLGVPAAGCFVVHLCC